MKIISYSKLASLTPTRRLVPPSVNAQIAFTLIEMLLVLVIIAVMVGGVVVSLQGRSDAHELKLAARDLTAAVTFASSQAAQTGQAHRVRFTDNARRFLVESIDPLHETKFIPVMGTAGAPHALPANITIVEPFLSQGNTPMTTTHAIVFDPTQGMFAGAVQLRNRAGDEITIEVYEGSSYAVISDIKPKTTNETNSSSLESASTGILTP